MTTKTTSKKIKELITEAEFLSLADKYVPIIDQQGNVPYQQYFEKKLNNLSHSEFLVPVLGIQGTGKSSLLNALLMEDLILPIDADETTCIPVEIRYGKENDGEIKVFFLEGKKEITITNPKELEEYVHNRFNLGNKKRVSHIVVYKDNDLLANNLVLVDLPGVGSLTYENVKVTMDYVEKLSAAMFLLRTVPPITKQEEIFLTNVWPKLTLAWFVQNQWNDESVAEVEDGKEHNKYVLQKIAERHQASQDIEIEIINVYQALNAKLVNDDKAYRESGLHKFRDFLSEVSNNWSSMLFEQFSESIVILIQQMKGKVQERLEDSKLTIDELRWKYQEEERKYEKTYQENRKKISEIEDKISSYKMELYDFALSESKNQMENLRNEMRRIIGSGLTDGHLLNKAYQDNESDFSEEMMDKLSMKIFEIQKELTVHLEELKVKDFKGNFQEAGSFYREEQLKGEKVLPYAGSIGGSIVGYKVGAITAAKVGTMIGSAGGPAGAAIGLVAGAIVGIGIAVISGWLGGKAKQKINEVRQTYTLKDLENPLRQFRDRIKDTIQSVGNEAFDHIEKALTDFKEIQYKIMEQERIQHLEDLENHDQDMEAQIKQLNEEYLKILGYEEAVNGKIS